jgi:hypothetical protein
LFEPYKVAKGFALTREPNGNLSGTADVLSVSKDSLRRILCFYKRFSACGGRRGLRVNK